MYSLDVSLSLQFALPYLRQRQGNIINVSSLVGTIGQKDAAPYVATKVSSCQCPSFLKPQPEKSCPVMWCLLHKGAIISMTKAMAVDESRYNVRVNW